MESSVPAIINEGTGCSKFALGSQGQNPTTTLSEGSATAASYSPPRSVREAKRAKEMSGAEV